MKKAWTMVEMTAAIIVIIILSGLCISAYKPTTHKGKLYVYSAMQNLMKANSYVIDKYGSLVAPDDNGGLDSTIDWYCAVISEVFSLRSSPNCLKAAEAKDANFVLANGVTIQGLASEWVEPFTGAGYKFKNIVVDVDGSGGVNKVWADRFPLRIYSRGKTAEGIVVPINCATDKVFNPSTSALVVVQSSASNPYCKNGYNPTGSAVSKDFLLDDNIITYDIIQPDSNDLSKAHIKAQSLSSMAADCMAYGGTGMYSVKECNTYKIRIKNECATESICATCTTYTCPPDATTAATCKTMAKTNNPNSVMCRTILHTPKGGMSFMIQSLVGDLEG